MDEYSLVKVIECGGDVAHEESSSGHLPLQGGPLSSRQTGLGNSILWKKMVEHAAQMDKHLLANSLDAEEIRSCEGSKDGICIPPCAKMMSCEPTA